MFLKLWNTKFIFVNIYLLFHSFNRSSRRTQRGSVYSVDTTLTEVTEGSINSELEQIEQPNGGSIPMDNGPSNNFANSY